MAPVNRIRAKGEDGLEGRRRRVEHTRFVAIAGLVLPAEVFVRVHRKDDLADVRHRRIDRQIHTEHVVDFGSGRDDA